MKPSYSSTCESIEASLSALIDGELEAPEQLPAVDHLLTCASCQDFYHQARALGSMVVSATAHNTEAAPLMVWGRIATEAGLSESGTSASSGKARVLAFWRNKPRYVPGALQLAAVLIVAVGLWLLRSVVLDTPRSGSSGYSGEGVVEVVLEQNRGSMSDERFLELTTELLQADRDYHRKMLQIMSAVDELAARPEGSGDEPALGLRRTADAEGEGDDASLWNGDQL